MAKNIQQKASWEIVKHILCPLFYSDQKRSPHHLEHPPQKSRVLNLFEVMKIPAVMRMRMKILEVCIQYTIYSRRQNKVPVALRINMQCYKCISVVVRRQKKKQQDYMQQPLSYVVCAGAQTFCMCDLEVDVQITNFAKDRGLYYQCMRMVIGGQDIFFLR